MIGTFSTTVNATVCTNCTAGTYGATTGLSTAGCTGLCSVGYYCPVRSTSWMQTACPAGTFGDSPGLTSAACSGLCSPGLCYL